MSMATPYNVLSHSASEVGSTAVFFGGMSEVDVGDGSNVLGSAATFTAGDPNITVVAPTYTDVRGSWADSSGSRVNLAVSGSTLLATPVSGLAWTYISGSVVGGTALSLTTEVNGVQATRTATVASAAFTQILWEDGDTWDRIVATPRIGHSSAPHAATDSVYVWSGFDGTHLDDMWRLTVASSLWELVLQGSGGGAAPAPRDHHSASMVCIPAHPTPTASPHLVAYSPLTGVPSCPEARSVMVVVGGEASGADVQGDLRYFDLGAGQWDAAAAPAVTTGGAFPARSHHAAAVVTLPTPQDVQCVLVFGGRNGATILRDLWRACPVLGSPAYGAAWTWGGTWEWSQLTAGGGVTGTYPSRRWGHVAALVAGRMLVWGGFNGVFPNDYLNDAHVFDPVTLAWAAVPTDASSPTARTLSAAAALPGSAGGNNVADLVLLGGRDRYSPLGDLFLGSVDLPLCAAGEAAASGVSTDCANCPAGRFSLAGAYSCTQCSPGRYSTSPGAGSCTQCPPGRYSTVEGSSDANDCVLCAAGYSNAAWGSSSSAACVACTAGRFSSADRASCENCPLGTATNDPASSECAPCAPGSIAATLGKSTCDLCDGGEYAPYSGMSACLWCPAGTWSASNSTTCTLCGTGTANPSPRGGSAAVCGACLPGSYADAPGQVACTKCSPGTANPGTGSSTASACQTCGPGTLAAAAGASTCDNCPQGRYVASSGASACDACPLSTYGTAGGAPSEAGCAACPLGTVTLSEGAASAAACAVCAAGTFLDNATQRCSACPPGTTSTPPAAGAAAVVLGLGACTACPALSYAPGFGSPACLSCPSGSTSSDGFQRCLPCSATTACPRGAAGALCSGHGSCRFGVCGCATGWSGDNCGTPGAGAGSGNAGALFFASASLVVSGVEGDTLQVTVQRSGGTDGAVSVDVSVDAAHASHTATAGQDYNAGGMPVTANLADGVTSATVTLPLLNDAVADEGCDVLALGLSNPSGGATVGSVATALVYLEEEVADVTPAESARVNDDGSSAGRVAPSSVDAVIGASATLAVTLTTAVPALPDTTPLDLVLLVDVSSSMASALSTLRVEVAHVLASVQAAHSDVHVAVASFADLPLDLPAIPAFGVSGDYPYQQHSALSGSVAAAQAALDALVLRGGGDAEQAQLTALLAVAADAAAADADATGGGTALGWRAGARRAVVVVTDSGFHEAGDAASLTANDGDGDLDGVLGTGEDYPSRAQVRAALVHAAAAPVFVVTAGDLAAYTALTTTDFGFGAAVQMDAAARELALRVTEGLTALRAHVAYEVDAIGAADNDPARVASVSPASHTNVADGATAASTVTLQGCGACARSAASSARVVAPFHGAARFSVRQAVDVCTNAPPTPPADPDAGLGWSGWTQQDRVAATPAAPAEDATAAPSVVVVRGGVGKTADVGNSGSAGSVPVWRVALDGGASAGVANAGTGVWVDDAAAVAAQASGDRNPSQAAGYGVPAEARSLLRLALNGTIDVGLQTGAAAPPTPLRVTQTYNLSHSLPLPLVLRGFASNAVTGPHGTVPRLSLTLVYSDGSTDTGVAGVTFASGAHDFEHGQVAIMPRLAVQQATVTAELAADTASGIVWPQEYFDITVLVAANASACAPNVTASNSSGLVNATLDADGSLVANVTANATSTNATNATQCYVNGTAQDSRDIDAAFAGEASFAGVGLFVVPEAACACASGFYAIVPADSVGAGTSLNVDLVAAATTCERCDLAYACSSGSRVRCGDFVYTFGAASHCISCIEGWTCKDGVAEPCSERDYVLSDGTCARCTPGYKCQRGVRTACSAGFFSPKAGGTQCLPCLPGTVTNQTATVDCEPCGAGFTAGHGRTACVPCPPGESSEAGAHPCHTCPRGTYTAVAGAPECLPCPLGRYGRWEGAKECAACPAATPNTAVNGSTSVSDCIA